MKSLEITSMICTLFMILSGGALWLVFKEYPSVNAAHVSGAEKCLKVILGIVFLISGLLSFVLDIVYLFV